MMMRSSKIRPGLLVCSARIVEDVAVETDAQVDAAIDTERSDRLAGLGVDRSEVPGVDVEQALLAAVGAAPEIHAARADGAFVGVRPELAARSGVERDDRAALREHVHRVADDQRIEEVVLVRRIRPRHFELADVALVDLRERRKLRRVGAAQVLVPTFEVEVAGGSRGRNRLGGFLGRGRAGAQANREQQRDRT